MTKKEEFIELSVKLRNFSSTEYDKLVESVETKFGDALEITDSVTNLLYHIDNYIKEKNEKGK